MIIALHIISFVGILLVSVIAGLWWAISGMTYINGLVFLIGLWVMAFDLVPVEGLKYLRRKEVRFFILPLACISTVGFLYGLATT